MPGIRSPPRPVNLSSPYRRAMQIPPEARRTGSLNEALANLAQNLAVRGNDRDDRRGARYYLVRQREVRQRQALFERYRQDFIEEAEAARRQTSSLRSYQMPSDDTIDPEKELSELLHASDCKKCDLQSCRHKKQIIKHFSLCPQARRLKVSPQRKVICGVCKVYLKIHEFHFDTGCCSGSLCPLPHCEEIHSNPQLKK